MSQTDLGASGKVLKQAQLTYEKGTRKPDSDYLAAIYEAGVDVNYLLTGHRVITEEDIDVQLANLSAAWEALDAALQSAGKQMPADKKRLAAEALYHAVRTGEGKPQSLANLVAKAA